MDLISEFSDKGSRLAISDAGCAAVLCINVFINTKTMTDRKHADMLNAEVESLTGRYCPLAENIYNNVKSSLTVRKEG